MITFKDIQVLNHFPVIAFIKDDKGRYVWVNNAWLEVAGETSPDDVIGKDDFAFFTEEIAAEYRNADKHALSSGKAQTFKEHVKTSSGKTLISNTCKFPADIDGQKYLFGIAVITE